jgi:hypothetical protein
MTRTLFDQRPRLVVEFHPGVDRHTLLDLLSQLSYQLPGRPIEPLPGETDSAYYDNRSYAFEPTTS